MINRNWSLASGVWRLAAAALWLAAAPAAAQDWKPTRPIEIIVSSGPGGAADREAREAQHFLQQLPGMPPIQVANRQGGGGTLAWTAVAQREGDAHILGTLSTAVLTNQVLGTGKLGYKDFTPLAVLVREYVAVWTRAESPITSTKELIARLRKDPASVSFGLSSALGNQNHIVLGLLAKAARVDPKALKIVVYSSGGQGMTAALGGHVDVWAGTLGGAVTRPASTIRVLGVSSPERQPGPAVEMPTFREQGVDVVYYAFRGFLGPGGLTPAQRAFWDQSFSTIVRTDEWKKSELKNGWGAGYLDSAATRKFLDSEFEMVKTMLTELGVVK
jgi:putative tricarboxylic transport membrane protein